jgi:hypothetical protein
MLGLSKCAGTSQLPQLSGTVYGSRLMLLSAVVHTGLPD